MSENSESLQTESGSLKELSHKRILLIMAVVIAVGSALASIFVSGRFGAGVFLGGLLAFGNYYWMKLSLKGIFEKAVRGENPRFLASSYIFRYIAFGVILLIIYLSKTLDIVSVLVGLLSFALAVLIEGLIRIFTSFNKQKEI